VTDPATLLRDARRSAGLSQQQLARRLGVSQAAVAKLEREGSNPTVRTLDRALRATGHKLTLDAPKRASGVDASLIRRHLELTPAQRIRELEGMYAFAGELTSAGRRSRGEPV
jgi:transcriptional regulator with XRE-family HTH domain